MRGARFVAIFTLLLCVVRLEAEGAKLTVVGKLVRMMAVGGESTGWTIELESDITVDGKNVRAVEVAYAKSEVLEKLANQRVRARGMLTHRHGVETGDRVVLELASIKALKGKAPAAAPASFNLSGEWVLEDLSGGGMIDKVQSTMEFPSDSFSSVTLAPTRVVGNGGCNRFSGTVEIQAEFIKFGPLASTRMMCAEAVMNQEGKYLAALQAAERFEWKDPYLLVYSKGIEKPLLFTRVGAKRQ